MVLTCIIHGSMVIIYLTCYSQSFTKSTQNNISKCTTENKIDYINYNYVVQDMLFLVLQHYYYHLIILQILTTV